MKVIKTPEDYEKAKAALCQEQEEGYSGDDIAAVMLNYRRQHNIFEVGDWITSGNETYQILSIEYGDLYKVANNTYWESGCFSHATDAEIKAGKRLEVNQ